MSLSSSIASVSGKVIPRPTPVSLNGIRFEALNNGRERGLDQNGGYISAVDEQSGLELWNLCVYRISFNEELPNEPQEVYIMKLRIMQNHILHVWDDFGEHFVVDTIQKTSRKLDF